MGANMTKSKPTPLTMNKCSKGVWNDKLNVKNINDINEEVYLTKSEETKDRLDGDDAFIKEVDYFCNNASLIYDFTNGNVADLAKDMNNYWTDPSKEVELRTVQRLNATVCTAIGDPLEWWPYDLAGSCDGYNNCDPGYQCSGCNGDCCAIIGTKQSCARIRFSGDPTVCCFKDYV